MYALSMEGCDGVPPPKELNAVRKGVVSLSRKGFVVKPRKAVGSRSLLGIVDLMVNLNSPAIICRYNNVEALFSKLGMPASSRYVCTFSAFSDISLSVVVRLYNVE